MIIITTCNLCNGIRTVSLFGHNNYYFLLYFVYGENQRIPFAGRCVWLSIEFYVRLQFARYAQCGQNRRHALKPPPNRRFITQLNTHQLTLYTADECIRVHSPQVFQSTKQIQKRSHAFACIDVAHSQLHPNSAFNLEMSSSNECFFFFLHAINSLRAVAAVVEGDVAGRASIFALH